MFDDLFVDGVGWFELDDCCLSLAASVDPSSSITNDLI